MRRESRTITKWNAGRAVAVLCGAMLLGCSSPDAEQEPEENDSLVFQNPVFEPVLADPTVLEDPSSGLFYAYGTQDNWDDGQGRRLVPVLESQDLVNWNYVGEAFTEKPSWKDEGGIWAPDINHVNDQYYLYYSYSTWGDPNPGVGLAIADSPKGPFTDQGKLFDSHSIGVPNSIDPFFFQDEEGEKYLFWGSFSDTPEQGTYAVALTDDGKALRGEEKVKIAAGDFEAVTIFKKDDFFYFLGSKGSCCEGASSQYHVLVARAEQLLGPYLDQQGRDIRERGHGTVVLDGSDRIAGPGHTSGIVTDSQETDWVLYHGIDPTEDQLGNGTSRRMLLLDRLTWQNGWPMIGTGKPSMGSQPKPKF